MAKKDDNRHKPRVTQLVRKQPDPSAASEVPKGDYVATAKPDMITWGVKLMKEQLAERSAAEQASPENLVFSNIRVSNVDARPQVDLASLKRQLTDLNRRIDEAELANLHKLFKPKSAPDTGPDTASADLQALKAQRDQLESQITALEPNAKKEKPKKLKEVLGSDWMAFSTEVEMVSDALEQLQDHKLGDYLEQAKKSSKPGTTGSAWTPHWKFRQLLVERVLGGEEAFKKMKPEDPRLKMTVGEASVKLAEIIFNKKYGNEANSSSLGVYKIERHIKRLEGDREIFKDPKDTADWLDVNMDREKADQFLKKLNIERGALQNIQDWSIEELFKLQSDYDNTNKDATVKTDNPYEVFIMSICAYLYPKVAKVSEVNAINPLLKQAVGNVVKEMAMNEYA